MAGSSKSVTQKQKDVFLKAYEKNLGNITNSCKAAGFGRNTFYYIKDRDAVFKEKVDALNESVGDFVESKLLKRINGGDTTGIIFYCKTKLKHRGYIERIENQLSGDKNNPMVTKIIREVIDPNVKS